MPDIDYIPATVSISSIAKARDDFAVTEFHWTLYLNDVELARTDVARQGLQLDANLFVALRGASQEVPFLGQALGPGVHIRRSGDNTTWTFERAYFDVLSTLGLVSGEAREVTFSLTTSALDAAIGTEYQSALSSVTATQEVCLGFFTGEREDALSTGLHKAGEAFWNSRPTRFQLRGATDKSPTLTLLRPLSKQGRHADHVGALPSLPSFERGTKIAVGSPKLHLVYQYNFDTRSGRGIWAYVYTGTDGRALPRIALHCAVGGWRHRSAPFVPQKDWPMDCFVQWGGDGLVIKKSGGSYRTSFFEAFPSSPSTFIRGEGEDVTSAEAKAYEKFERIRACGRHVFEKRGYTNGGGFCIHCNMFSSKAFEPEIKS